MSCFWSLFTRPVILLCSLSWSFPRPEIRLTARLRNSVACYQSGFDEERLRLCNYRVAADTQADLVSLAPFCCHIRLSQVGKLRARFGETNLELSFPGSPLLPAKTGIAAESPYLIGLGARETLAAARTPAHQHSHHHSPIRSSFHRCWTLLPPSLVCRPTDYSFEGRESLRIRQKQEVRALTFLRLPWAHNTKTRNRA